MLQLVILSLKRSKALFVIMAVLYLLALLQVDIFLFARATDNQSDPLLSLGFVIAAAGYLAGLLGVEFLVLRQFSYEMGNLETLGYSRLQYLTFFTAQFKIICFVAWLFSIPLFSLLYGFISNSSMPLSSHMAIHFISGVSLLALTGFSVFFFGLIHSTRDPFMLLKEKS